MGADLSPRLAALLRESPTGLRQPDQRSCGAASLVVARMLLDEGYADRAAADFAREVLALHGRVTGPVDARGAIQLPWPRALGTPPWAVARDLSAATGRRHDDRLVTDRTAAYERLVASEQPAGLFVGSRWLPRHVVLVVAASAARLTVYEPSQGVRATVERRAFLDADLGLAGWPRPWFTVTS